MRRILIGLVVVFVLYSIYVSPAGAAHAVSSIAGAVGAFLTQFFAFLGHLVPGGGS